MHPHSITFPSRLELTITDRRKTRFPPFLERFWQKVDKRGYDECWNWLGSKTPRGYGAIRVPKYGINLRAHRVSWELHNGLIPKGMVICHKCDNPSCVNPQHLFLGTQRDNMRDCAQKGRLNSYEIKKTHCPKGHPYMGSNLVIDVDGKRKCRICINEQSKNAYRKRRERCSNMGN